MERCWHDAMLIDLETDFREVMQVQNEVDTVVSCATCGKSCRAWLYYSDGTPLLMLKEEIPWGEIDYYSWTGTEWWEE